MFTAFKRHAAFNLEKNSRHWAVDVESSNLHRVLRVCVKTKSYKPEIAAKNSYFLRWGGRITGYLLLFCCVCCQAQQQKIFRGTSNDNRFITIASFLLNITIGLQKVSSVIPVLPTTNPSIFSSKNQDLAQVFVLNAIELVIIVARR